MVIKNRKTGEIIFSGEYSSMRECVEDAVRKKVNLRGSNLRWVDLRDVDLQGVDLREADLFGSALYKIDFRGSTLRGSNFRGSTLYWVDLREADLREVDLQGADLCGVNLQAAVGITQWQATVGAKRTCYSVAHKEKVMHKIGCFWGDTEEAASAIIKKYGDNSSYEKILRLNAEALQ